MPCHPQDTGKFYILQRKWCRLEHSEVPGNTGAKRCLKWGQASDGSALESRSPHLKRALPPEAAVREDIGLARCPARYYQRRPCHSGSAVTGCPRACWVPGSPRPPEFSQNPLLSALRVRGSLREEMDSTGATPPRLSALPTPTPSVLLPPGLPERAPRALTPVLTLSWSREAPRTRTRGWVGRNPSARGWRFTGREVLPSASPAGSCGITG